MSAFSTIEVERRDRVGLVRLNRPEALNALNTQLMVEVNAAVSELDQDDAIGCIVLTGSEKAFAAGADIKEMKALSYADAYRSDWFAAWDRLAAVRKPLIAEAKDCRSSLLRSDAAEYGDLTRGPPVLNDATKMEMTKILDEIRDGSFAEEWIREDDCGRPKLRQLMSWVERPITETA